MRVFNPLFIRLNSTGLMFGGGHEAAAPLGLG